MKAKLVKESLNEWFVEDSQVDGDGREEHNQRKKGFHIDIETETIENEDFRRVLYTGNNIQLVLMTLNPGEEIGAETHDDIDQFFRFDKGKGKAIINSNEYVLKDGDAIVVPAGCEHNIIADPKSSLKMYTVYGPPHHMDGITYKTKEEAETSDEEFDGEPSE